jgi:hypothetical protein
MRDVRVLRGGLVMSGVAGRMSECVDGIRLRRSRVFLSPVLGLVLTLGFRACCGLGLMLRLRSCFRSSLMLIRVGLCMRRGVFGRCGAKTGLSMCGWRRFGTKGYSAPTLRSGGVWFWRMGFTSGLRFAVAKGRRRIASPGRMVGCLRLLDYGRRVRPMVLMLHLALRL